MAVEIWRGPGGTAGHPKSGSFTDASNWSENQVPDGDTVVFGAGRYAVNLTSDAASIGGLQIGAGVTLTIDQQDTSTAFLQVSGDSVNSGRLVISGAGVQLNQGSTLINYGEIYGANGHYTPTLQGGGLFVNEGLIAGSSGSGNAVLILDGALENDVDGVVNTRGGSRVIFTYTVDNQGLLSAIDGGRIDFDGYGTGSTLNLGEGILNGGHWSSIGAGSTLLLYNSEISQLDGGAVVTLDGAGSFIGGEDAGGVSSIESTLESINAGAELHVLGDRDYTTTNHFDVDGLLEIGGGVFTAFSLLVHDDPGSSLVGYGEIDSDLEMYGVMRAAKTKNGDALVLDGTNDVYGKLIGRGTLEIAGGTTVLQAGAQVFVKDLVVDGQNSKLQLSHDLVYDGKLTSSDFGAVDLGGNVLRLSGKVTLDTGVLENGAVQLESGQINSTGLTILDVSLRNDGTVTVKNGIYVGQGAVNGTGEFHIGAGATLGLAYASTGQTIHMDGAGSTFDLYTAAGFKGEVVGYAAGDTLTFSAVDYGSATTLTWKADQSGGGTLTLVNGAEHSSVHLEGTYQKSQFHLAASENDGTDVTYGPSGGAAHPDQAPWDAHGGLVI